jgi:ribokinase
LKADSIHTAPGGKALNQAVTLARLDARVAVLGTVGSDAVGRDVSAALTAEGIDISTMTRLVPP